MRRITCEKIQISYCGKLIFNLFPLIASKIHYVSTRKETSNSLYRQWQILSRLSTGKWMGTRELQEILNREGIEISLRTIQRDLNQIAQRFPIESSKTTPQGWRWRSDAPIQSLPHMTSSQAVTFMMVEEHLKHLLPPSLIEEMNPWFDLARHSLSSQNNVRQWINRVRIVPATQPLIPPVVDKTAQQAIYEGLLQDKQLECVYQGRGHNGEEKTYILNPLALVQKVQLSIWSAPVMINRIFRPLPCTVLNQQRC